VTCPGLLFYLNPCSQKIATLLKAETHEFRESAWIFSYADGAAVMNLTATPAKSRRWRDGVTLFSEVDIQFYQDARDALLKALVE
jgi:hypothetical protein